MKKHKTDQENWMVVAILRLYLNVPPLDEELCKRYKKDVQILNVKCFDIFFTKW